jgi:hypothetical protein
MNNSMGLKDSIAFTDDLGGDFFLKWMLLTKLIYSQILDYLDYSKKEFSAETKTFKHKKVKKMRLLSVNLLTIFNNCILLKYLPN